MTKEFFSNNRAKLLSNVEDDSILVFFSGNLCHKCGDEFYPFSPNRNFYYLTGIDEYSCVLIMTKLNGVTSEYLLIKRRDEKSVKWVGESLNGDDAQVKSGIKSIEYTDNFYSLFSSLVVNNQFKNLYLDLQKLGWDEISRQPSIIFSHEIRKNYPALNIKDAFEILSALRKVKTDLEINSIKNAIALTNTGLQFLYTNMKEDMIEYEIDGYFDFILKINGIKDTAFKTIVAGGKNATILHYRKNNSKISSGDLVLLDLGATYNYYNADITRTVPINGRFTKRQRKLYNIVLEGQKYVINAIRPGILYKTLNEMLLDFYELELSRLGLIKDRAEISKYYYHKVSHYLGLDTHDVGNREKDSLEVGNVITIEPGLYIEEEGIGIRIEDDICVTEDGCDVLSKDIIKTVDEIEEYFRGR